MLYWNYFMTVFTDPGHVPPSWVSQVCFPQLSLLMLLHKQPQGDTFEAKRLTGQPRYCRTCEAYKPPRTHHCRQCKRYVWPQIITILIAYWLSPSTKLHPSNGYDLTAFFSVAVLLTLTHEIITAHGLTTVSDITITLISYASCFTSMCPVRTIYSCWRTGFLVFIELFMISIG